jgi:hypothetical protein
MKHSDDGSMTPGFGGGWNYRILHCRVRSLNDEFEDVYGIHEVYYGEDGTPRAVTVNAVGPHGETLDEFTADFQRYARALDRPALEMTDFEPGGRFYRDGWM